MKVDKIKKTVLISIMILFLGLRPSIADVGSFDSYDSGDSGSSSSSDWDSSGSYYGGYHGGGSLGMGELIFLLIVIAIITYAKNHKKGNGGVVNRNTSVYTTNIHDVSQTHIYADKIKEVDPLFSEEEFLSWAKDLYVKLQHAWTDRDWEVMRMFETEKLYEQHSAQLQEYVRNNTINVVERIAVNYATIYNFRQTEDKDIVEVALKATKKDYIINATTKEVVEGNKDQYRITVYKLTFERTKGQLTQESKDEIDAKNCPNCGAPLKVTSAGKCEYCGCIVSAGVHDWVLSNIEPLRK